MHGGDFNCIVNKMDASQYPEAKMSRGLQRLINLKNWQDSFRTLYPSLKTFSRYYENSRAEGATRIDRNYHFGDLKVAEAKYLPLAFSDHFALVTKVVLADPLAKILSPKSQFSFRLSAEVIKDPLFKQRLVGAMMSWQRVREFQGKHDLGILQWWELLVKPGIRQIGIQRSKEMSKEKREEFNLLLLRQRYLT